VLCDLGIAKLLAERADGGEGALLVLAISRE
jgi:hypothetical protein